MEYYDDQVIGLVNINLSTALNTANTGKCKNGTQKHNECHGVIRRHALGLKESNGKTTEGRNTELDEPKQCGGSSCLGDITTQSLFCGDGKDDTKTDGKDKSRSQNNCNRDGSSGYAKYPQSAN